MYVEYGCQRLHVASQGVLVVVCWLFVYVEYDACSLPRNVVWFTEDGSPCYVVPLYVACSCNVTSGCLFVVVVPISLLPCCLWGCNVVDVGD